MGYELIFYETRSGHCPTEEFVLDLKRSNSKMGLKVVRDMGLLKEFGPNLKMPQVQYLERGLYELRSFLGSDTVRIFYFFFSGDQIILTNGFKKKTQKIPPGERERAFRYKKDYEDRNANI